MENPKPNGLLTQPFVAPFSYLVVMMMMVMAGAF